jgi:hypothetical protein
MGDLRLALRLLVQDRTFTLTTALTLMVCIGANVALFAIVYNVLLKPLPVPDAERMCRWVMPTRGPFAHSLVFLGSGLLRSTP